MGFLLLDNSGNFVTNGSSLFDMTSGGGASLRPTTTATSITVGSVTFSWTGSLECGYYVDGQAFVVAPLGVTLSEPTPALSSISSRVINGCVKNLERQVGGNAYHAFDSAVGSSYSASFQESFPSSAVAGDVYVKAYSKASYGGDAKAGVVEEYAALAVVSTVPPINAFCPPVAWPAANKANRPTREADVAAVVATFPSYASSAITAVPTYAQLAQSADRFIPTLGFTGSASGADGYEGMTPYGTGWWNGSGTNYGRYFGNMVDAVALALMTDGLSTAEKEALTARVISWGIQWWEGVNGASDTLRADGGHWQMHLFPVVLALHATGQSSKITEVMDVMPGNLEQMFIMSAQDITDITTSHTSKFKPYITRQRTLTSVSGTTLGFTLDTANGDLGNGLALDNLTIERVSDGATATVVSSNMTGVTVTINAQPGSPFQVGDTVFFYAPWTQTAGQAEWAIRGGSGITVSNPFTGGSNYWNYYSPSVDAPYRTDGFGGSLQYFGGQYVALHALGLAHSDFDGVKGYLLRSKNSNDPTSGDDYPDIMYDKYWLQPSGSVTFQRSFYSNYWTTISGVTQTVG